jgi:hypothetical protein
VLPTPSGVRTTSRVATSGASAQDLPGSLANSKTAPTGALMTMLRSVVLLTPSHTTAAGSAGGAAPPRSTTRRRRVHYPAGDDERTAVGT